MPSLSDLYRVFLVQILIQGGFGCSFLQSNEELCVWGKKAWKKKNHNSGLFLLI